MLDADTLRRAPVHTTRGIEHTWIERAKDASKTARACVFFAGRCVRCVLVAYPCMPRRHGHPRSRPAPGHSRLHALVCMVVFIALIILRVLQCWCAQLISNAVTCGAHAWCPRTATRTPRSRTTSTRTTPPSRELGSSPLPAQPRALSTPVQAPLHPDHLIQAASDLSQTGPPIMHT